MTFMKYRAAEIAEMRPYVPGEDMEGIYVFGSDHDAGSPKLGDMIARDPDNYTDQWLVPFKRFADNFMPNYEKAS